MAGRVAVRGASRPRLGGLGHATDGGVDSGQVSRGQLIVWIVGSLTLKGKSIGRVPSNQAGCIGLCLVVGFPLMWHITQDSSQDGLTVKWQISPQKLPE
jgi:hypothetical protein